MTIHPGTPAFPAHKLTTTSNLTIFILTNGKAGISPFPNTTPQQI